MGQSRLNATSPLGRPSRLEVRWTARVGELAACCVSRSPCFPQPGWLGSWTHPPLDSIQEGGCCFFLWIFWIFVNPVAQEEEKEEGADLGRNVRESSKAWRGQKELGATAARVWNRDFRVILFCFRTLFQWKV